MLIVCPTCARQYDVTRMAEGDRVRCLCDAELRVARQKPRDPRAVRCSSCGAPLGKDALRCQYCESEVTLEEKKLAEICPLCCARMSTGARYCMECGLKIQPQALEGFPAGRLCPRCKGALRTRALDRTSVVECIACAGLWVAPATFEAILKRAEDRSLPPLLPGGPAATPVAREDAKVQYLPCIQCRDLMTRRNFAETSGVVIDVCKDHGVWLDHTELEKVYEFVRAGGLLRTKERQVRRLEDAARAAQQKREGYSPAAYDWRTESTGLLDFDLVDALSWLGKLLRR